MEHILSDLSSQLGIATKEIYSVLQVSAGVDGQVAGMVMLICAIAFVIGFALLLWGLIRIFRTNDSTWAMVIAIGFCVCLISSISWGQNYRTNLLCKVNPKGYAIEKIFDVINSRLTK